MQLENKIEEFHSKVVLALQEKAKKDPFFWKSILIGMVANLAFVGIMSFLIPMQFFLFFQFLDYQFLAEHGFHHLSTILLVLVLIFIGGYMVGLLGLYDGKGRWFLRIGIIGLQLLVITLFVFVITPAPNGTFFIVLAFSMALFEITRFVVNKTIAAIYLTATIGVFLVTLAIIGGEEITRTYIDFGLRDFSLSGVLVNIKTTDSNLEKQCLVLLAPENVYFFDKDNKISVVSKNSIQRLTFPEDSKYYVERCDPVSRKNDAIRNRGAKT